MNLQENNLYQLQINICEHLSGLIIQIDNKINNLTDIVYNLEHKINIISEKLNNIDIPNKKNSNSNHNTNNNNSRYYNDINDDSDVKRKISNIKKTLIIEKEKEKWIKEYKEQEELLIKAKEEWTKEQQELQEMEHNYTFSYLN
jgi:hypothetical protein